MAEISKTVSTAGAPNGSSPRAANTKLSFASKVAAMAAAKQSERPRSIPQVDDSSLVVGIAGSAADNESQSSRSADIEKLQESVARLDIVDRPGPIIASTDTDGDTDEAQVLSTVLRHDDEKTHLSFVSNPTVSTDVRSVVSGTTFALDEKESIRPDDSASVKAAEDDESGSGGGSRGPQSGVGSEAGKEEFRDQFHEISSAKKALPLGAGLAARALDDGARGSLAAPGPYQHPSPDEKLMEAMRSPKDRLFLLQLEQEVISFIKNPEKQILPLPPQNSFCRLLAHRLGDYYALSHTADASSSIVSLGKTELTRLPPSLNEIAGRQATEVRASATQQPALKIMRRADRSGQVVKELAGGDSTNVSSAIASRAGSDIGGTDASPGKTKPLTREEREAKYQATRERIFGDSEEAKPSTDTSTAASRASSANGGKGKKAAKGRLKIDDFEPRSSFMGYAAPGQQLGYGYGVPQGQQVDPNLCYPSQTQYGAHMGPHPGNMGGYNPLLHGSPGPYMVPNAGASYAQQISGPGFVPGVPSYHQMPVGQAFAASPIQVFHGNPQQPNMTRMFDGMAMNNPQDHSAAQNYQNMLAGQFDNSYYAQAPGHMPMFNQSAFPVPYERRSAQQSSAAYGQQMHSVPRGPAQHRGPGQGFATNSQQPHMNHQQEAQGRHSSGLSSPSTYPGWSPAPKSSPASKKTATVNENKSELGKYDTSSLPPKPPAPSSTGASQSQTRSGPVVINSNISD